MGIIINDDNRQLKPILIQEDTQLSMFHNNAIITVDSPTQINLTIGKFLAPGFKCSIVQRGLGKVVISPITLDGITFFSEFGKYQTNKIGERLIVYGTQPNEFLVVVANTIIGNTGNTIGAYKLVNLYFDGTAGFGAIGSYSLEPVTLPSGTIIDEILFDAFPITDRLVIPPGLTAAAGSYITVGLQYDSTDCALDSETGLVATLNENRISKIIDPNPVKCSEDQLLVMAIGGAPITSGFATIIIKTLNFEN